MGFFFQIPGSFQKGWTVLGSTLTAASLLSAYSVCWGSLFQLAWKPLFIPLWEDTILKERSIVMPIFRATPSVHMCESIYDSFCQVVVMVLFFFWEIERWRKGMVWVINEIGKTKAKLNPAKKATHKVKREQVSLCHSTPPAWVVWRAVVAPLKFLSRRHNTTTTSNVTFVCCIHQSLPAKSNHPPPQLNINTCALLKCKTSWQAPPHCCLHYCLPHHATPIAVQNREVVNKHQK